MADRGAYVRKNYFVRKGFQLKFSLIIFITTLVISVIAIWTTYITTWSEISTLVQSREFVNKIDNVYKNGIDEKSAGMINSIVVLEFAEIFSRVSNILVLRLIAGSFVLFILSIFVSHKIAGPISRMEKAAHAIENGDLSVDLSTLRAGDELADLARAIDGAIVKIRFLMQRYREMATKLTELAVKISAYEDGGKGASEESTKLIRELEVVSSQLVTEMNFFRTKKQEVEEVQKDKPE
ncbi:MAG: HAMP domain-containing protein [Candidatus Omnitrophica bacterium]|nr:HAMP domain-containing protein [Candidatus Omnitrophota bacterium]MBU4479689.1 HAMP domain-containing protein [Candidatus Omnitrophota bacterium]MCG2703113.1 HAMP domain-containing protein [Candidatus Omnitrophota bacterium]